MSIRLPAVLLVVACGGGQHEPAKPGDDHDEGAGLIAQASQSFVSTSKDTPDTLPDRGRRRRARMVGAYGGDPYGGSMYGGDPYGGSSYAHWTAPTWNYQASIRMPHYVVTDTGLDATLEGTVTWPGKVPADLKTPCGPFSTLQLGANRSVRGVIVYIERITTGRGIGGPGRAQLGGMVAKRGCTLGPSAQLAVPIPTSVTIHGDATRTRVKITSPAGSPRLVELQEGGLATAEIKAGVTTIEGEDGKLAPAWIVGLETPYFSVTDDTGKFRIEQLAPGSYDVTFWQPPLATLTSDGRFAYGKPIVVHRSITVAAKQTTKVSVALPSL